MENSSCWRNKIEPAGIGPKSKKAARWCARRSNAPVPGRTRWKPPSPPCTPNLPAPKPRIGRKLPRCTCAYSHCIRRRSWALNRAVAVAMADGYDAGLALVDELEQALHGYHLWHAARADLLRRLGRRREAITSYTARARTGPQCFGIALSGAAAGRARRAGQLGASALTSR